MTQPDRRHLRRARLALAVVVAAALAAWLWFPGGRTFLQQSLTALASLDPQQVRGFIAAWGPQAALVSFALMILQAIVAPLPAFLITLANAALFGAFWGGALSWFSAMAGAGLCFCIARALGREVVEKLTGRAVLRSADGYFTRFGPQTILVCRLLPFVPFDPVSYAAGLTSLRFWPFMLATGVGQSPGDYRLFLGRESAHRGHLLAGHRAFAAFCPGGGHLYRQKYLP